MFGYSFSSWYGVAFFLVYLILVLACVVVVLKENRNPIRALA